MVSVLIFVSTQPVVLKMMLRILTVLLVIKLTTCEVCEPEECKTPKHYEELGCEPVKKKGDCCASR